MLRDPNSEQVMLSIAVVLVCDSDDSRRACRTLLDCGSQANFVSKKFVESFGLETHPLNVSISAVNGTVTTSNHVARIKLQSRLSSYTAVIECIMTDRVTDKIPAISSERDKFSAQHSFGQRDSHIVGYWSFNRNGVVLEFDMRWSSLQTST